MVRWGAKEKNRGRVALSVESQHVNYNPNHYVGIVDSLLCNRQSSPFPTGHRFAHHISYVVYRKINSATLALQLVQIPQASDIIRYINLIIGVINFKYFNY